MKLRTLLLTTIFSISYFVALPSSVSASFLDEFINGVSNSLQDGVSGVKNLISPAENKNDTVNKVLAIDSAITLAPGGDVNKNGQIDAGDTITFTYNIKNSTDKKYIYTTLKTNIQRESINSIRNITGVTGLKDDGKTLEFPNLRIDPSMVKIISFDANLNYFTEQDPIITTEPELITEDKKTLLKSDKKQTQGKRIKKEDIPNQLQMTKKIK